MKYDYNEYSKKTMLKLIDTGKQLINKYNNITELVYGEDFELNELRFIELGFKNPEWKPEFGSFYRIGEPIIDSWGQCYRHSWNYAEDCPESGVSVVTSRWLCSFKSVFFGAGDEDLKKKGVYKITGLILPAKGGDDEPLIIPCDWAEKTEICTFAELKEAVEQEESK